MQISVVVADTEFLMRRGLKALVQDHILFNFVGEVTDAKDLKKVIVTHKPDVLVIDHCCDDCFSLAFIKKTKDENPELNILVISHEKTVEEIKKIIAIGIKNYLLKDCNEQEIIDAIRCCAKGEKYFCGQIIDVLLEKEIAKKEHCNTGGISERELDVIKQLVKGKKPIAVADELNISYHTVIAHKKNIYKKLGINTNVELMQYALKTGIIILN